jgi:hypothetical protein
MPVPSEPTFKRGRSRQLRVTSLTMPWHALGISKRRAFSKMRWFSDFSMRCHFRLRKSRSYLHASSYQ